MLALVPGVSRSGATIVGSLLLGTDKRSAAEFTFFIAIPIMTGAFGYDLYKNRELITTELGLSVGLGFAAAFLVALLRRPLRCSISSSATASRPFAYWRIFVGAIGLWGVLLFSSETISHQPLRIGRAKRTSYSVWPSLRPRLQPVGVELRRLVDAHHLERLLADRGELVRRLGAHIHHVADARLHHLLAVGEAARPAITTQTSP